MNHYIHAHGVKAADVTVSVSKTPYDTASLSVAIQGEGGSITELFFYTDELLAVLAKFAQEAVAVR